MLTNITYKMDKNRVAEYFLKNLPPVRINTFPVQQDLIILLLLFSKITTTTTKSQKVQELKISRINLKTRKA